MVINNMRETNDIKSLLSLWNDNKQKYHLILNEETNEIEFICEGKKIYGKIKYDKTLKQYVFSSNKDKSFNYDGWILETLSEYLYILNDISY